MRSVSEAEAPALMAAAQPLLAEFGYATLALFGRDRPGVILRAANKVPPRWPVEPIPALPKFSPFGRCFILARKSVTDAASTVGLMTSTLGTDAT